MTLVAAIYLLLGFAAFGFIVWALITYVAKASPFKEIVIAVAVILAILVLLQYFGVFLDHAATPHVR
jgi:hypothetical protein